MTRHECDYSLYDWSDLSWDEQGHDMRPGLLIGNGFSKNIWSGFGYGSLFEKALQNHLVRLTDTDRAVFEAFETNNFEVVLNVLAASKAVSKALGQNHELLCASTIFRDALGRHESRIRRALIQAVHSVHVSPSEFLEQDFLTIAIELAKYMSIYYTNYDLLIYMVYDEISRVL